MNFLEKEKSIKEYIETNFTAYLADKGISVDAFIDDYMDFDRYKKSTQCFYSFENYAFQFLSNESREESITFHIYFVVRNGETDSLKEKLENLTTYFYDWFYGDDCDCNFGGIADYGLISTVDFYNAVEGNPSLKLSDLTIQINLED